MNKESKLSEFVAHPNRSLWKLALPMTIGLFVNSIYILVDTYFIGNIPDIGTNAISALGYVMPFYFIIMGVTFGLSSGATTVIAQYIGKGNRHKANQTAHNSLFIAATMTIINFLFIFFFGEYVLSLQGMNDIVFNLAKQYFYVMGYGSIFMIFGIFLRAILVGEGESILPMNALGLGTILNIIFNPFFIYSWGLDLGIAGAAYATIASQLVVLVIFLYFFLIKKTTYIDLVFKKIKCDFSIWKKIFNIGFPGSISMLIMSVGLFFMNSILATAPNGDAHVAAYNLSNRIENFITLTLISISTSQVTIIGMFYGAKRFDLIKPMVRYTTFWSMLIASIFSLIAYFFIQDITSLFFDSNSNNMDDILAIDSTISYYKIMFLAFPFIALTMVSTRSIQAIGQAWPMTIITIMRVLIIQCGLSYFFIVYLQKENIEWAWFSIAISCIIAGIIAYFVRLYFLRDQYLERKI